MFYVSAVMAVNLYGKNYPELFGTLGASPNLVCVRADSGITSLAQLIAMAKAQPDRFNYASPGIGTTPHLAGEVLKLRTGIQLQHVPFLGAKASLCCLATFNSLNSFSPGSTIFSSRSRTLSTKAVYSDLSKSY